MNSPKLPSYFYRIAKEMGMGNPELMSRKGLLDMWLTYNGIIGYTRGILSVLKAIDKAKE